MIDFNLWYFSNICEREHMIHAAFCLLQLQCFTVHLLSTWLLKWGSWGLSASQEHRSSAGWSYKQLKIFFSCSFTNMWHFCFVLLKLSIRSFTYLKWFLKRTILDSAAHDGLFLFAVSSGLGSRRLDAGAAPSHPQLEGEVVAWQHGDDRVRHHGNVVGSVEGEDQGWVRRREGGQRRSPVGCRGRRWEEIYFAPDSTWWRRGEDGA